MATDNGGLKPATRKRLAKLAERIDELDPLFDELAAELDRANREEGASFAELAEVVGRSRSGTHKLAARARERVTTDA